MKKILLVKEAYNFFPIGLAHIITALRKKKMPYDLLDMGSQNPLWRNNIVRGEYSAVGIGGLYADFNFLAEFSKEVKRLSPQTPFILGGNITTDIKQELLFKYMPIDFAVIGEGETILPELLEFFDHPTKNINSINGIVYRNQDGFPVSTARRKPIDLQSEDLYPTWQDFNMEHYLSAGYPGYEKFRAMPVLTGRGCTGRCIFCSPTNGRYRMRPIHQVIEELLRLDAEYRFDGFAFLNEIMYPTQKMLFQFLDAYKKSGLDKPWIASLRVDIGIEMLKAMKDCGCVGANCGVESGNDRVLKQIRKNITVKQVKEFYRNCKEIGLTAQGSIMFGSETESEHELKDTVDLIIHEDIHSIGGTLLISYPGTEVYERALSQGKIKDEYTYLKNLDFSDIGYNGTFRNVNYLNMSGMDDDTLFRTVAKQSCRQHTYNYLKFTAQEVDFENLTGRCAICGSSISFDLDVNNILNCISHCKKCFSPVYLNIYQIAPFDRHAAVLKNIFSIHRRIAIYGCGQNARYLHFRDIFWFDLDNIVCCIDEFSNWKGPYFFNAKVIDSKLLPGFNPDIVLIADTISPTFARTNLNNVGISSDRIVSLVPEELYENIFDQYVQRYQNA